MQGEVTSLWRYPVKSMLGEQCTNLELDSRGVAGDRVYAIKDSNGKFGSGKNTRRFRKIDGLFRFQATLQDHVPSIRFPGGTIMKADHPDIGQFLSDELGQTVSLACEGEVPHMDAGAVHIISAGSLHGLREVAPEGTADARRFRPNIVLSTLGDCPEQRLLGKRLKIGNAELKVTNPTERCGMVAFQQSELDGSPTLLRYIKQNWELCVGVYAEVVVPGFIGVGDKIKVVGE
ncbi:MAG: MOSC domain-containing protein [Oceanococcus sp.]